MNSREFAIENGMFRVAEFRHCFFDSPWVSQVRSRFKSVLYRPSDLAPGVCMQRPQTSADTLIAHPQFGYAREKGKRSLMFIKLKVKFSNSRQKCSHNDALINVAAQHFFETAHQRPVMAAIVKTRDPLPRG